MSQTHTSVMACLTSSSIFNSENQFQFLIMHFPRPTNQPTNQPVASTWLFEKNELRPDLRRPCPSVLEQDTGSLSAVRVLLLTWPCVLTSVDWSLENNSNSNKKSPGCIYRPSFPTILITQRRNFMCACCSPSGGQCAGSALEQCLWTTVGVS